MVAIEVGICQEVCKNSSILARSIIKIIYIDNKNIPIKIEYNTLFGYGIHKGALIAGHKNNKIDMQTVISHF